MFGPRFPRGAFCCSSHTSDLKTETPEAALPGAWRYKVSTGTGWRCVSVLSLDDITSLICNFCFSVAARTIVSADLYPRYTSMLQGQQHRTGESHRRVLEATSSSPSFASIYETRQLSKATHFLPCCLLVKEEVTKSRGDRQRQSWLAVIGCSRRGVLSRGEIWVVLLLGAWD